MITLKPTNRVLITVVNSVEHKLSRLTNPPPRAELVATHILSLILALPKLEELGGKTDEI